MKRTIIALTTGFCLSVPGCKSEPSSKAAQPAEATTEIESKAAPSEASNVPSCELDGHYRFRFASNGSDGWWFRFSVDGVTAKLLEPVEVLALEAGPLVVEKNLEGCQIVVRATSSATGELTATLNTKPGGSAVSGTLVREKSVSDGDQSRSISGVHDVGEPKGAACIVPGNYIIKVAEGSDWKNQDAGDDRDCGRVSDYDVFMVLKLEPYGETFALTMREDDPPYAEGYPGETLTTSGDCQATFDGSDGVTGLNANLTFSADGIKGAATRVSLEIIEDGPEGEGIWTCVAENAPLVITKVAEP